MIIIYILASVAVVAGVLVYLQKTGKIKDTDGDLIPDVVEDKIEEAEKVVKETKRRAKRVIEEAKDVIDAVNEVANQANDVVDAIKGKSRKGRKPTSKKKTPKKK
jgi:methyl-accepting chemotaxis protein